MNTNNKTHLFVMIFLLTIVFCVMTSSSSTGVLQAQSDGGDQAKGFSSNDKKVTKGDTKKSTPSKKSTKKVKISKDSNNKKQPSEDSVKTPVEDNNKPGLGETVKSLVTAPVPEGAGDKSTPPTEEDKSTPTAPIITPPIGNVGNPVLGQQQPNQLLQQQAQLAPPPIPCDTTKDPKCPPIPPLPPIPVCTQGFHLDKKSNTCVLNTGCSSKTEPKANSTVIYCEGTKVKTVKSTTTLQPIIQNYYTNTSSNTLANNLLQYLSNIPAQFLLLLDSKQLCLIAGDFQCVAQQNQFATSSLTITYDSVNKIWSISGTVKDVSKFQLNNVQVTALFYDGKGNPVGNAAITNNIIPNILNTFEDGTFAFNVSVNNDLNGINPLFIVLSYSQQHTIRISIPKAVQHPINSDQSGQDVHFNSN